MPGVRQEGRTDPPGVQQLDRQSQVQPLQPEDCPPQEVKGDDAREWEPPRRPVIGKVATLLCAAVVGFEAGLLEAPTALPTCNTLDLAVACCTKQSPLMDEAIRLGGSAERFSVWNGYDLPTTSCTNRLITALEIRKPRRLWFPPPCDPWTSAQNTNASNEEAMAQLKKRRRKSKRIFNNSIRAME